MHWVEGVLTLVVDVQVNRPDRDAIPYDIVFHGVAGMRMTELDVWLQSPESRPAKSSFDEVTGSAMLAAVAFRFEGRRHFSVVTYDDVFEIIATGYEFIDVTPTPGEGWTPRRSTNDEERPFGGRSRWLGWAGAAGEW
jgi:hypothetical protein